MLAKRLLGTLVFMLLVLGNTYAQSTTINTFLSGTNYNGNNSNGSNSFITFALENNSGGAINITDAGKWVNTSNNGNTVELWYSSTSLGGAVTLSAPVWTKVATGTVSGVTGTGVFPVLSNISFQMPAGATYRFALNISGANYYTLGTATPNNFTASGVTMYTGDHQFGGNVGYGGANNPRFFTGFVTFEPAAVPCDDTVESAVVLGPNTICPNKKFDLSIGLSNGLAISGLTYQWQYSINGRQWSNFTGVPNPQNGQITDAITDTRWYRCIVTCTATNKKFTTPVHKVDIAPFYYCYCTNLVREPDGADIGNVKLINLQSFDTVVNNGNGTPVYNNADANRVYTSMHDSISWPCLYRDTSYKFRIAQIHSDAALINSWVQVYIDYNRDGLYNPINEKVFLTQINGGGLDPNIVDANITVPNSAEIGETGMRIIISDDSVVGAPCDTIKGGGEVEDYIVKICYRPCDGPTKPGIVMSTDTSMCTSYEYMLTDTSYEDRRSAFSRSWQISGDDITWFNINNSQNKDTLQRVFGGQPLYYRLRVVCPSTGDTTFSPATLVNAKPGFKCYCYSKATGGSEFDSSDIGSIAFGNINVSNGGPHLQNPNAVRPRTDHTDGRFEEFFVDSTYNFYVYHTMNVIQHEDAKVTIFMDFNNNKQYDIPDERIYTGYTSVGTHTLSGTIRIPKEVIVDVPTGARFIINNNIAPSKESDSACGGYVSGETEDFIVVFRNKNSNPPNSITGVTALGNFGIHPNPTNGIFNITFNAVADVSNVGVRVTNITGQTVYSNVYGVSGVEFNEQVNITDQPSGVYFVELNADGQKLVRKLVVQ